MRKLCIPGVPFPRVTGNEASTNQTQVNHKRTLICLNTVMVININGKGVYIKCKYSCKRGSNHGNNCGIILPEEK